MAIQIDGATSKPSHAYIHCRPDGSPFYVGKGTEKRANSFRTRNPYYGHVVSKHGEDNILVGLLECSSDKIAFDLEQGIIKCLKRMGVELTNMNEGGTGFTQGHTPWHKGKTGVYSDEVRAKISAATKKQMQDPARREINRNNMLGVKHSDETKAKIGAANRGNKYSVGRTASTETKLKMAEAKKGNTVARGRVWVTNGETTKMVYKNNIPEGFKLGRKL